MDIKDFYLDTPDQEKIKITAFGMESRKAGKCVIFVHGFKGFKDWGFGPYIGRYLAERGIFTLTFNFSHNGIGEKDEEFTEPEKFASNTYSREVQELSWLIDTVNDNYFGDMSFSNIGLIGHSRGGAVALLTAWKKPAVKAVALWGAVSRLDRFSGRQKKEWRKTGVFSVKNQRTGQVMKMNIGMLEDIEKNSPDSLNIERAARELGRPLLIAHGDQDMAVPVLEGEQLYKWSDKQFTEFFKIYNTGHTFDIVHPFAGSNEKFERLLTKTNLFFQAHLI